MKQYEAVIETLKKLGGAATLGQLNQEVLKVSDCKWRTKTPFASIRRIVQERPEIYKIKPGLWALESHKHQLEANGIIVETAANAHSKILQEFNHTYYQGLLLHIGNIDNYQTYVPAQDKNKKFLNTPLSALNTLNSCIPNFSYKELTQRSSSIDVIWFSDFGIQSNALLPSALFEIEHSTDIQNSLLKFNDLRGFDCKMFIVADERRKSEFFKKISYSAFRELRNNNRVSFFNYDNLVKLYEQKTALYQFENKLV